MDYGIKISTDTNDVKTCADKDLVLTSKYKTLKGVSFSTTGTASVPQTGVTQTITFAHGLGYIPILQSFWSDVDGVFFSADKYYSMGTYVFGFGGADVFFYARADATNVYLDFTIDDYGGGGSNVNIGYAYYIFIDKARL